MTAQEKLNKIDAMLYKAGFCDPNTVTKVKELIEQHKANASCLEYAHYKINQAQHYLEFGCLDD